MAQLDNYRKVEVTVGCDGPAGNIIWQLWTTRTDEQLSDYAKTVGRTVCMEHGQRHWNQHTVALNVIEVGAGAVAGG